MPRIVSAGLLSVGAIGLVILVMTATPNEAQGPPDGLDVTVINPPGQPVPVTGSLGVSGTADVNVVGTPDVNVVNTPTVEVTDLPAVELQGPPMTGDRLMFGVMPAEGDSLVVPAGEVLTDVVVSVPSNASCLFTIFDGSAPAGEIFFRTGIGGLSESSRFQMHLQTGLPGPVVLDVSGVGTGESVVCSGQFFWRGFET